MIRHTLASGAGLALLLLAAAPAGAQDPCEGPTTAELRRCAERRFTAATEELTRVLAGYESALAAPRRALLRESQDAWERHRGAFCRFAASVYEGGSLQPLLLTTCFAETTEARTRELWRQWELEQIDDRENGSEDAKQP